MFEAVEFIGLYAETPLHPGSGSTAGAVDLPVQRETHTGIPLIPGSSLKGVLRHVAEQRSIQNRKNGGSGFQDKIDEAFGPSKGDLHGGALAPTDARLLLFPVRSLEGIFIWVTCPMIIERLQRDLALAGKLPAQGQLIQIEVDNEQAKVCSDSPLGDHLVLEENEYTRERDESKAVDNLATLIASFMPDTPGYSFYRDRLNNYLAVISNTDYQRMARTSTEVVTRIKLNEQKTTTGNGGNMWTEEFLPSDCLFYSLLLAMPSRKHGGVLTGGSQVLDFVKTQVQPRVIQIGGDETVGRGWMRVRFLE